MSTPQTQDDYLPTLIDVGPDTAYEVQTVLRSSVNQYKFLYRRVIVLSKGENKLLPLAQSAGLYAGTESESHETVEEKTTTLNTLYGVPVCEVGNDVFTVIVTGFGSSENKHDMEVLLQNTFKNCGKILAVTAPRVGVTRGFVTFFAKEAHQNALKQIKRKSASSGSSGTPKAVGVGTASSASSESASQRATSKESKTSKPAGGGTTGTTRRRASPRGGKGSWTPKAA